MSNVSFIDGHIDRKMTPQETLELLNNVEFADQYQGKDEYGTMLLLCKDALEKQIPKKPHRHSDGTHYCECGEIVRSYQKYCDECGWALDWSDAE